MPLGQYTPPPEPETLEQVEALWSERYEGVDYSDSVITVTAAEMGIVLGALDGLRRHVRMLGGQ